MELKDVLEFKRTFTANSLIFSYSGAISQEIVEDVGDTLKNALVIQEGETAITRKIFAIFVEVIQNIMNYSAETMYPTQVRRELRSGIVLVGRQGTDYFICSGNLVEKDQVNTIREQLDFLKHKNNDELRAIYRKQLQEPQERTKSGAGLGFIEMARKASKPLEYHFEHLDEDHMFFSFKAIISR